MIFVMVGTHEQQFNRLLIEIDKLKESSLEGEVFAQIGYSDYTPKNYLYKDFLNFKEINSYMEKADIIITHGGPSSFIEAMNKQKRVIVVPRLKEFDEHVNDHQIDFCLKVKGKGFPFVLVEEINDLERAIKNYDSIAKKMEMNQLIGNTPNFVGKLKEEIIALL